MNEYILKMGQVESIDDDLDGGRIKVRLAEDKNKSLSELPYAFPLNPKVFQCMPKVGEGVLVVASQNGNSQSQRYYLGPIISQMQNIGNAPYNYGAGNSISLLQGAIVGPNKPISQFALTDCSFPDKKDIAIIGRKSEDVILKEGEIDIRCGVRKEAYGDEDNSLIGNVIFNAENPAYIQMKHKPHLMQSGDGVINLVADRINLVSHQDNDNSIQVNLTNPNSKQGDNSQPLLKDEDIDTLMSQLHQLPYGDILVNVLRKMYLAIVTHTHAFNGLPPCEGQSIKLLKEVDFGSILSNHIRIS